MYSSDEDDYKNINFPTFIPAKKSIYEWNKLDFEYDTRFVFVNSKNSKLDLEESKIFDLWENKFDIKKMFIFVTIYIFTVITKESVYLFF